MTKYPNAYFRVKPCRRCGEEFTPNAPSQLYCSPECRGKNSYYKRNYGITQDTYNAMKEQQDNKCFLCGGEGFIMNAAVHHERLVVDHDHETGLTRKLLCHNCNRALGLLQDSPHLLRKAADYIEYHKEGSTTIPTGSTAQANGAGSTVHPTG